MMKRILLLGVAHWASVFACGFIFWPIRNGGNATFFETLMMISLVFFTVLYGTLYFNHVTARHTLAALRTGVIWMGINLVIDLPMFLYGPMARPFEAYMEDIGYGYVVIPIILWAIGNQLESRMHHGQ